MLSPIDVKAHGSWRLPDELDDPELRALATQLPTTILGSCANSTVTKYLHSFRRWKNWACSKGIEAVPAKPHLFALYLQHLSKGSSSKASVEEACNAVSWVHTSAGLSSPSCDPFVKATLEGLQRSLAKPTIKKEPVTVDMLEAVVKDADNSGSLTDLCLAAAAFSGFCSSMS